MGQEVKDFTVSCRNPIFSLYGGMNDWGDVKTLHMALHTSVCGSISREDSVAGLEPGPLSWSLKTVPPGLILRDSVR